MRSLYLTSTAVAELSFGIESLPARRQDRPARVGDAEVAAVAMRRGFVLATRNTEHFAGFGVPLLDSWQDTA